MQSPNNAGSMLAPPPAVTIAGVAFVTLVLLGSPLAADTVRDEMHERLGFLVGKWSTSHAVPSGEGEMMTAQGEAVIEWVVGDSWLRHEFHADVPGRGEVFETHMMNFSPPRGMYSFYLFDHFGGEAGSFYGGWIDDSEIVVTAEFVEDDGTTSYQKYTLTPVSEDEIWISRAFSDDGVSYHFEVKGVYTRKND